MNRILSVARCVRARAIPRLAATSVGLIVTAATVASLTVAATGGAQAQEAAAAVRASAAPAPLSCRLVLRGRNEAHAGGLGWFGVIMRRPVVVSALVWFGGVDVPWPLIEALRDGSLVRKNLDGQ